MDSKMTEWMLSFPCSRCAFMGIEKLGTVHVLGKDEHEELQIVAFCYDCARVMMERRKRPHLKERKLNRSPAGTRVVALTNKSSQSAKPILSPDKTFEACKGAVDQLQHLIEDVKSAVDSARHAVSTSEDLRREIIVDFRGTNTCAPNVIRARSESL
jgi:hypothetical protein